MGIDVGKFLKDTAKESSKLVQKLKPKTYDNKTYDHNTFYVDIGDNSFYKMHAGQYQPVAQLTPITYQQAQKLFSSPILAKSGNLFQYSPLLPSLNAYAPHLQRTNLQDIGKIDKAGITAQAGQIQTPIFNVPNITPQQVSRTQLANIGDIDTRGITAQAGQTTFQPNIQAGNVSRYFNPEQLREDIYQGIKTQIMQEREDAQKRLEEALTKTGLFRSGINLENQQKLERSALDALAKGWGQAALQVANLQTDIAKTQAALDTQTNIKNAELKADLDRFNAQLRTQTDLANARNLLEKKITEYDAKKQIAIEQGRLDLSTEIENAKNNLQAQLANLQAKEHQYQIESDLAKTQASLETQTSLANAQNLLQSKIAEYETKKQLAIEQGRLDQARDFENAQNNLKAQLANLEARMRQDVISADLAKTQAQLSTQTNLANAQNILQTKLNEYETKKQLAIEQGRLDQAREFENAQNILKAQSMQLQAALEKYRIQTDQAKTQAMLDQEISKFNVELQNAIRQHQFDKLLEAAAIDQEAINKAKEFNITIQNAYDEIAFKWAASLLDQEIREYAAKLDLIAKAQAANAQYGTKEAKTQWNTLAYQYAQPSEVSNIELPAYNNSMADLTNQVTQLQNQLASLQKQNQQLQNQLNQQKNNYGFWDLDLSI